MDARATDAETRVDRADHGAIRLWLRMLATNRLVETRTRRLLQERYATTLPRFDLMAQLERVPRGLKMGELSKRMMVTGGNVTGITDMLEKEGLVERVAEPGDRRARLVRLTGAGRRAFSAMAEEHERWIVEAFKELSGREMSKMAALLARLKAHVRSLEGEA
ncbi:MAG TPA: MarR family transcriptional regulator [Steroidobacteraceae bacterium]|jgi:DNA-binding MarR family transcriptional regulator|nr:MarR family transcriptional regulator [Steroidobacteraceae bacterium]